MRERLTTISLQSLLMFLGSLLLIYLSAKLGQYFFYAWHSSPAVLWPATGIALSILWLGGYRFAVPVFLGLFAATLTGPNAHLFPAVVTTPAAQTLGLMFGAYLLRLFQFEGSFARMRNVLLFFVAVIASSMVGPTITTAISWATGNLSSTPFFSWSRAWAGYVFSSLILFPLITSWARNELDTDQRSLLETGCAGLAVLASVHFLFWTRLASEYAFIFFAFFFIAHFWVASRFSSRALTLAVFATTVFGIAGLYFSPSPVQPLNVQLFNTELFLLLLVPIFYSFSALVKERSHTFEELKAVMHRIRHESNTKTEFIAVLAHELRNPLAPLKTTLEILNLQEQNEETKRLIASAQKQVYTMRRLLEDLLDITRFSQGKFQIQRESANLSVLVSQSIDATRDLYQEKWHKIVFDAEEGKDVWLDVDPVRFEQVVVNLLNNAAKYTDPGGRIEIRHTINDKFAEITITDNGQGIDAKHIQDIFEPFWQKNSVPRGSGIGIGLSLTKRIVEMHGGTISAESRGPGKGTTIIFTMPLSESRPGTEIQSQNSPMKSPHQFRILVVDDNEAAANALTKLLKLKGYTSESARDGKGTLESVRTFKPNVILLDIGLPDIDGYEIAKTLRDNGYLGAIVAVSGYGLEEDKRRALQGGFDHHFTKPVAIARLEEYFETL